VLLECLLALQGVLLLYLSRTSSMRQQQLSWLLCVGKGCKGCAGGVCTRAPCACQFATACRPSVCRLMQRGCCQQYALQMLYHRFLGAAQSGWGTFMRRFTCDAVTCWLVVAAWYYCQLIGAAVHAVCAGRLHLQPGRPTHTWTCVSC
jgi:hypothetical protein